MRVFLLLALTLLPVSLNAQWVRTSGPSGGAIHAMGANDAAIFAATDDGLYRSTDNGGNWSYAGPAHRKIISFVANGSLLLAGSDSGHVYRSTDLGTSWAEPAGTFPVADVNILAASGSYLFAGFLDITGPGTGNALYRSSDGGISWSSLGSKPSYRIYSFAVGNGYLLAGGDNGVSRSTDNGETWSASTLGHSNTAIAVDGMLVLAGQQTLISHSTDGGMTWSDATFTLPGYVMVTAMTSYHHVFFAATDQGLFRSTDSRATWAMSNAGLTNRVIECFAAKGNDLFAGSALGGVNRSTDDGATWAFATNGIPQSTVYAILHDGRKLPIKGRIMAGTGGGAHGTDDLGGEWSYLGLANDVRGLALHGGFIFACTRDSGVYRTSDDGATWEPARTGLDGNAMIVNAILSHGDYLLAATADGVYRTSDDGGSWEKTTTGIGWLSGSATALTAVGDAPGDAIYAGYGGFLLNGDVGAVLRSTDGGLTWDSSDAVNQDGFPVRALAANGSYVWAGSRGIYARGLSRSTDNGKTWTSIDFLPKDGWYGVLSLLYFNDVLYAGTEVGVYYSTDRGDTWTALNDGLPPKTSVLSLAIISGEFFIGTSGRGVWHRSLSSLGVVDDASDRESLTLLGNTPNPFSATTTVRYHLSRPAHVTISIHDMLGHEIGVGLDELQGSGDHTFRFDASGLPDGVYCCSIRSGSSIVTGKMMVVR
jgi:photosystem II stability/assembly factor-like uncharacterized protein